MLCHTVSLNPLIRSLKNFRWTNKIQSYPLILLSKRYPPWLTETLEYVLKSKLAYFSEKSRSESIVFPILLELQRKYEPKVAIYSGAVIDVDKKEGLNGECDFVFRRGEQSYFLQVPIFCVVEAKDNDMKLGLPQCVA